MNSNDFNKLSKQDKYSYLKNYSYPCPSLNIGKITLCTLIFNQPEHLELLLKTVKPFVSEIIIFNDGSTDSRIFELIDQYNAKQVDLPEGWLLTWGYDHLAKVSRELATGDFVWQLDSDRRVWIPSDQEKLPINIDSVVIRQITYNPFIKEVDIFEASNGFFSKYSLVYPKGLIHQGLDGQSFNSYNSNIWILHDHWAFKNSELFETRRMRLYSNLMKKAYETNTFPNEWWTNHYKENKHVYESQIKQSSNILGELKETTEKYKLTKGW